MQLTRNFVDWSNVDCEEIRASHPQEAPQQVFPAFGKHPCFVGFPLSHEHASMLQHGSVPSGTVTGSGWAPSLEAAVKAGWDAWKSLVEKHHWWHTIPRPAHPSGRRCSSAGLPICSWEPYSGQHVEQDYLKTSSSRRFASIMVSSGICSFAENSSRSKIMPAGHSGTRRKPRKATSAQHHNGASCTTPGCSKGPGALLRHRQRYGRRARHEVR